MGVSLVYFRNRKKALWMVRGAGGGGGKRWMMSGRYRRAPGPIGAGGQRKGVDFGLCTDKTGFCPSHFERKTKCCLSLS